ncbi:endonuclease I family protein [Geobacillus thermodenitrificans]|uniref:Endonuclease I n=1 Tax=Geobacillus thermodenitrificans (strain NG80-2) TaxID=420246 RepID=A4IP52_GEOTN|nr:endonuclease [Geobacillus thermodenitrificans]ABO67106.1 Conserved hypothetical protein [Geobacillus thermodenitrificans NG80-2]
MGEAERQLNELRQWQMDDAVAQLEHLNERLALEDAYYRAEEDRQARERYYRYVPFDGDGLMLFVRYHELVAHTHKRRLPYFFSKDEYLYTWVDLQPDGTVRSLYSGERKDPKTLIVQDVETMKRRYDEFRQLLKKAKHGPGDVRERVKTIEKQWKFNAEHVVPQSWFGAREPMKGDLHHLFVCQPECNTLRSNFPYADFPFYNPEDPGEQIQNRCGVAHNGYFEPEYGKGTAARAMLYFLLRYPKAIEKSNGRKIDIPLLVRWHEQFPPTVYEYHRNTLFFFIQGNRNPFILFPELARRIVFPFERML